jgi:c-di-GMP-binding flagellar brake protein YcgR
VATSRPYIRAHPRLNADLPLEVEVDDDLLRARAVNISRAGMQLAADRHTTHALTRGQGQRAGAGHGIECLVRAALPGQGEAEGRLEVRARVAFVRREAENAYGIGLQFLELTEAGRAALEAYIARRLSEPPARW